MKTPVLITLGFLSLVAWRPAAWADDPVPAPCDSGDTCSFQSVPLPLDSTIGFGAVDTQGLFGMRIPAKPLTQARERLGGPGQKGGVPPLRNWALTPLFSSRMGTKGPDTPGVDHFDCSGTMPWDGVPNEFDANVVQGLYQDDMWEPGEQAVTFAPHTIFMVGTSTAGVGNLEAGLDKTYPKHIDPVFWRHAKYATGTVNHGVHLSGGTYYDAFQALGAANFGWLAFDSMTIDSNTPPPYYGPQCSANPDMVPYRLHGRATGSENHAYIGRRISSALDTELTSGVDARANPFKEDDRWDPTVAIGIMTGTVASAHLDNARTNEGQVSCFYLPESDPLRTPGFIYEAIAVDSSLVAGIPESFININTARVMRLTTALTEDYLGYPKDPNKPGCVNFRCDGLVRDLVQLEVSPVQDTTDYSHCESTDPGVRFLGSVGMLVADCVPNGGGGSAIQNPALVDASFSGMAVHPEAYATIVAKGSTFLGDGGDLSEPSSETGYDTDVVHVKDTLHLVPRSEPPSFHQDLASSDRIGVLYFDQSRGTLRVSVPAGENGDVVWMDVALTTGTVDLKHDLVAADDVSPLTDTSQLAVRRAESHAAARAGTSVFTPPSLQALPLAEDFAVEESGRLGVSLLASGFGGVRPQLYFRHEQHVMGKRKTLGPWKPVDAAAVAEDAGLPQAVRSYSFGVDLENDYTGTVQFMAIHPATGRTAGASVHVTSNS